MKSRSSRPAAMISRAIAFARAMSDPTSSPSQLSAHSADEVRRGSIAYRRAPLWTALRTWWKKIGCVSRALLPQRTIRSVSSASRYELVPPPAPNTAASPATLGACQVRLQLSMLLLPMTTRANFWAKKFTSLVAFEQLNRPNARAPCRSTAMRNPSAARSKASSQVAGRKWPWSRTRGSVSRTYERCIVRALLSALERNALRVGVEVKTLIAEKAHDRHLEMVRRFDGKARRCRDGAEDRGASHGGFLHD